VTDAERFYDTIAGEFDTLMNPYDLRRRMEVVFDGLLSGRSLAGLRVLDVGCGTGPFTLGARDRGAEVVSLDVGLELLGRARSKGAPRPLAADAAALPFADATFDLVISSECIEHTARPESSIAEMLRVLRIGGVLVLTCPNRFWHWSLIAARSLALRPYRGLENWPGWRTLRDWVSAHGGIVRHHVGIHLFPFVFPSTQPILRRLDRFGRVLGPVFVNQGIYAVKSPATPSQETHHGMS
jgi:2-polyprenyl-6-hydroxyphenyl methylase/3-demethylubiquinone-9 3-methyltransferase